MEKKPQQDKKEISTRMTCFAALLGFAMAVLFVLFLVGGARVHNENRLTGQEETFRIQGNYRLGSNEKFCMTKTDRAICALPAGRWQELKEDTGGKKRWALTMQSVADQVLSITVHRMYLANIRLFQQGDITEQWERMKTVRLQI